MNRWSQMQGGQKWILPKEINADWFFWDSHWLKKLENQLCSSMGPNWESAASASEWTWGNKDTNAFKLPAVQSLILASQCYNMVCNRN